MIVKRVAGVNYHSDIAHRHSLLEGYPITLEHSGVFEVILRNINYIAHQRDVGSLVCHTSIVAGIASALQRGRYLTGFMYAILHYEHS